MLTPDYLAQCVNPILGMYDELDKVIISDIARRIIKTKGISPTAEHQIDKVQQSGMLLEDVIKQIATATNLTEAEVKSLFEDASITGIHNDAKPLLLAGVQTNLHLSRQMEQLVAANIAKTNSDLRNLTMTTAVAAQNLYIEASNMAFLKVQSGAFSYSKAIRDAIKAAATGGNFVLYPSGKQDRLDVAVRRCVLTGVNQTAAKLTEMYAAEMGCEYYETSAHAGARPSHALWQGRVFKIRGEASGYPNFADSTGYGTGDGLCGWNCRHSFYPFWPGLSTPAYTKAMLEEYDRPKYKYGDNELTEYEVSQTMRKCERGIRETKREIAGYQAAMDATTDNRLKADLRADYEASVVKLKKQQARYKDLCDKTNHRPDTVRTGVAAVKDKDGRILSYGRSAGQRTRRAYERVAKAADTQYNRGSTEKNISMYLSDEKIRKRLRSESTVKTILPGRQEKHIRGSGNYTDGRSYLTVSINEAQELVNKYSGTGRIARSGKDDFVNREICVADHIIGVAIKLEDGTEHKTRKFAIHYAKNGTHIVPVWEE